MTRRVRVDPPTTRALTGIEQRSPEPENLFLGQVEVRDTQIEMELLRVSGIRPPRRPMVLHPLECEHEPRVGMKGRPAVIE
ncbi:hypothetical protein EES42_37515 [Streptomyces sp. ADI95-17]|nr:hypothetical protein EES42_37515 [Streptomyces sp. ADI95-17]